MKAYTSKGDSGFTKDFAGKQILKDEVLVLANGKIDFLQAAIDMAVFLDSGEHKEILQKVQQKLWQAAGEIANCPGDCLNAPVTSEDLADLEKYVDSLGEPPRKFVRFTNEKSIWFNECRVRCRELETLIVKLLRNGSLRSEIYKYINRLSSLFFMLGFITSEKK